MAQALESVEGESDGLWELPEGWAWTKLGDVASLRGEKVQPKAEPNLPFVGMDDIEAGGTKILQTRPFGSMKSAGNRFHKNDVLYGRLRPYLNKTALALEGGACSGELLAITPSIAVSPKYLQLFMHARRFVNKAMSTVNGDRPRIDFATIESFDFPLAPLAEQKRIVARVDALFAEIAEGEAALDAAREGLDIFRRALLKAAVTGELTKDWRALRQAQGEGADDETGHDLLARIRAERANQAQTNGRGRRAADARPLDTAALPELPEGWAWGTLGEIAEIISGLTPPGVEDHAKPTGAVPWFKVSSMNLSGNETSLVQSQWWLAETEIDQLGLPTAAAGSIVFPKLGGALLTNKRRVLAMRSSFDMNIMALTPHPDVQGYVRFFMNGVDMAKLADGSVVPQLKKAVLSVLPIPIPPPAEAAEILRRVSEALVAQADTLVLLDAEAGDAARLKQSILKAAFEGRLVPQDPADEPASVMLARLKATAPAATQAALQPKRGRGIKPASPDAKPVKRRQRKKPAPSTATPAKRRRGRKPKT